MEEAGDNYTTAAIATDLRRSRERAVRVNKKGLQLSLVEFTIMMQSPPATTTPTLRPFIVHE